jgi:hypothetical protein
MINNTFIYCNSIFSRWQWSVNLYKNREQTAIYKRRSNTQNNTKNPEYTKWKINEPNKKRRILKNNINRVIRK